MFTGIVQSKGRVASITPSPAGLRLVIDRGGWSANIARGDSVCVSGVCLTAVDFVGNTLAFDVVPETLGKTTMGRWQAGDAVNLETAVPAGQPMGGHVVQGHVDGIATVQKVDTSGGQWRVVLAPPTSLMRYLVPKGSVTLDGVSLTLAAVHDDGRFEVALIPETLTRTTLGQTVAGDTVNIEADVMVKTILHDRRPAEREEAVTMALLRDAGFLK